MSDKRDHVSLPVLLEFKRVFNHLKAKIGVGREAGTGCDGGGQYRSFANHLAHLTAHLSTPSPAVVGGRGRWCSGRR